MLDYPITLPIPDYGSYSGVSDHGLVRTSIPVAAPNQLLGFNSPTTKITMTFSMDNDTYTDWLVWVTDNGWNWFKMPVVSPLDPVLITSTHSVRFISEVQYQKRGDNWLSVSVTAEMIPGEDEDPLASTGRGYDYILAGAPASPSADTIVAGTPAAPSTPFIEANIYNYEVI